MNLETMLTEDLVGKEINICTTTGNVMPGTIVEWNEYYLILSTRFAKRHHFVSGSIQSFWFEEDKAE